MIKGILLSSDVQVVSHRSELRCVVPVLVTESAKEDEVREDGILVVDVLNPERSFSRGEPVGVWRAPCINSGGSRDDRYHLHEVEPSPGQEVARAEL